MVTVWMNRSKRIKCLLGCGLLIAVLTGCKTSEEAKEQNGQQEVLQEQKDEMGQQQEELQGQEEQMGQQQEDLQEQPDTEQPEESSPAEEDRQGMEPSSIRIWGPVLSVEEGRVVIDNRSDVSFRGEMILSVDGEQTRILDAENGYPVELSELSEGEAVFVYIGPTAALSEPPIVSASLILCKIPDSLRVPDYVRVSAMEEQSDGSYFLSGDNEIQYLVPMECEILPYLTRNVVTLQDVQAGSTCLIWTDERRTAQKIVLFAD